MQLLNRYRLIILILIELVVASNVKWGKDRWKQVLSFDGKGYYAYLPAIFIYDDLKLGFHDSIEKTYASEYTYFDFRMPAGNGIVNKYFAGTSLAILPFFLVAHAITLISGGLADGYSFYYQLAVSLAAIFYGIIGLYFLGRLLRLYNFSENLITIILLSFALATPLFDYTVFEPSMSHIYSFAFINLFLFKAKKFVLNPEQKSLLLLVTIFSLIVLIRPVNGIIVLALPFLAGSKEELVKIARFKLQNVSTLVIGLFIFIAILSIQSILYYLSSGNFFVYSYGPEKIIWNRPEIFNILFSYKKGLFVYAPLLFISSFGLIPLWKKSKFGFTSMLFFLFVLTYVISCWWIWWYGGGFGGRPFIEFYGLFAILFGFLLQSLRKPFLKISVSLLVFFCFFLCQIQIYQYRYFFIHWEKMDKEHYWRIFMRLDQIANKEKDGNPNQDLLDN